MNEITVSAKTLDDAITEASIQLGVASDQMEYDVIEKGSAGFLGIGSRQAVIRARIEKNCNRRDQSRRNQTGRDQKRIQEGFPKKTARDSLDTKNVKSTKNTKNTKKIRKRTSKKSLRKNL